ncbi:hypothetical protein F5Y05DRAFT_376858 [Hypoxylon sp. FL0543]|nr:hypothetical protein F5Y05DRAFT_376858 [Hypoxylon sp. FL0543]
MESSADPGSPPKPEQQVTPKNDLGSPSQRTMASKIRVEPTLHYRKMPACLLIIYLPTLIVPWVLICIMTRRPLGGSSYYEQTGRDYVGNAAGLIATQLLKTINAVLAVPIISTLLANAAIVYAMRRRPDQKLSVQQLFALADKGWSNIPLLWSASSRGRSSRFLWLAALLIALGAILQPLISVLVTFEAIAATSCLDIPIRGCSKFGPMIVGYDPEPADMPRLQRDLVIQDVLGRLVTVSDMEPQPNLWPINPNTSNWIDGYTKPPLRRTFLVYSADFAQNADGFFVTALDNGTNTGVLREHAIRLNSSVHCEHISRSDFPSPCPGAQPLEARIDRSGLTLSICAPGNASQFPFTPSRHRQDISEDLYVDLEVSRHIAFQANADNFTMHCSASTSRGYFELGNEQNGYIYGPLLDRWPDPDDIAKNFNDFRSITGGWAHPTEEDPSTTGDRNILPGERSIGSPFSDDEYSSVPGPLMVSADALFGNYSLLRFITNNVTGMTPVQAYESVCEHGNIPFTQPINMVLFGSGSESYCFNAAAKIRDTLNTTGDHFTYDFDEYLTVITANHARLFNTTEYAEYALMMSMYFANRAVLTKTAIAEKPYDVREIYHSPGTIMARPSVTMPSLVIITILIFLQTIGLFIVIWLIYSVPTWAPALDAMEIARISKALADNDLPPLGPVAKEDEKRLTKVDGLIGVATAERIGESDMVDEEDVTSKDQKDTSLEDDGSSKRADRVELALGGKGLITRATK